MSEDEGKIRAIAFYLPQFHAIPENDEWWGKGFTEWTNVKKAKPLFYGHQQPHVPTDELGYYDLEYDPDIQERQAQMAREHGIYGFCYYYYWFHGKRLLEKPLDRILESGKPDFPFCVCWANETWSRRWDGQDHEILIEQQFSAEDDADFIRNLIPFFKDARYIKIDGRPFLAVWRSEKLPNPKGTVAIWREEMKKAGLPMPYLVRVSSHVGDLDPAEHDFDAVIEFAPDWGNSGDHIPLPEIDKRKESELLTSGPNELKIFDYETTIRNTVAKKLPPYKLFRGVFPSWDNTARRGENGTVFVNSSPENFSYFLKRQIRNTLAVFTGDERLLFVNAWNEWAEGCHLEPDTLYGKKYLEICKDVLSKNNKEILELSSEERQIQQLESLAVENIRLRESLKQAESDVRTKHAELFQKEKMIDFVTSSKYWKLREASFKIKFAIYHPDAFIKKYFRKLERLFDKFINSVKSENLIVAVIRAINYVAIGRGVSEVSVLKNRVFRNAEKSSIDTDRTDSEYIPKVSVIVPNYNHEKFLRKRLDSIYSQTYGNYEVILLDDDSSDHSRKILKEYAKRYSDRTVCDFNEVNSGSVFSQWQKGMARATGDLIWIAESDDFCDDDFLEKLTSIFYDESIMLAYAHPIFVDENGKESTFTFEDYVSDLSRTKWRNSYIETAHTEVNTALGIKNTIPNVSGVVFRNILNHVFDYESLRQFKVCGDWFMYLSLIRGGRLAYVRDTNNYYRFHQNNTSSNYQTNIGFINEHEKIARYIAKNFRVDKSVLLKNIASVTKVWNARNSSGDQLPSIFRVEDILKEAKLRKPNILIAIFAFTTGGGEIFPIRLANELMAEGFAVTVFDHCYYGRDKQTTRSSLCDAVPVIRTTNPGCIDAILREFGIDIVHSHHLTCDLMFADRKAKEIPQVVTMHGMYETLTDADFAEVIKRTKNNISQWVYVAEKNMTPFIESGWSSGEFIKISNGYRKIDKQDATLTRAKLNIEKNAFVITLASRAILEKGWEAAINAVEMAGRTSRRKIILLLIGDGPVYDELRMTNLPDSVRLIGFAHNVVDYFSLADIGLLPTTYVGESCPMTLVECLSAERPFVATNIGEIKKMMTLDSGEIAGSILELKGGEIDIQDLAYHICKFANDGQYYESIKMNSKIRGNDFSMDKTVDAYVKIYNKLTSKK